MTTQDQLDDRVTALEIKFSGMADDVGELKDDVKKILGYFNRALGGWKALLALGSIVGTGIALWELGAWLLAQAGHLFHSR